MARGTTLKKALRMLKGELGNSLSQDSAIASDDVLCTVIENTQKWLAGRFDWPFLVKESTVSVAAGAGSRYLTLPSLNFERPVEVECLWNNRWHPVGYGITQEEYNTNGSGDSGQDIQVGAPVVRWRLKPEDDTLFEIWPLPSDAQVLRFKGQRYVVDPSDNDTFNLNGELELDDLLVVLYSAAKFLTRRKKEDARLVLAEAESRLSDVRSPHLFPNAGTVVLGHAPTPQYAYWKPRTS